jgi:hypothetical protein
MFRECICIGCQGLFIDVRKEKFGGSVYYIAVLHHATQLLLHFPQESPQVEVNSNALSLR